MPVSTCRVRLNYSEDAYSMNNTYQVPIASYLNIKEDFYAPENDWKTAHALVDVQAVRATQKGSTTSNLFLTKAFFQFISNDDVEGIEALTISGKVDLQQTCTGNSLFALYIASSKGYIKMTRYLLENGVNVNQQTADGYTALHAACQRKHSKVVEILLQYHANIDIPGPQNVRAVHFAVQYGYTEILGMLLSKDADIFAMSGAQNLTCLMLASQLGHVSVVQLLLKKNDAGLHIEDNDGNTALHFAAREGKSRVILLLLNAGADALAMNDEHDTPIDLALYYKHTQAAKLLEMSLQTLPSQTRHISAMSKKSQSDLQNIIMKNRVKYARVATLYSIQE